MSASSCNRWGNATEDEVQDLLGKKIPKSTKINQESQWNQFLTFCDSKGLELNESTTISEIASILKNYACNMRRRDGKEYKECVVKTLWNSTAKRIQEIFFHKYNIKFNPFTDIEFKEARTVRDRKRKQLQEIEGKRKVSAVVFIPEESMKMQKNWDENTPEGLQKKFFNIVANKLAWRGNEAAFATVYHFNKETDNSGNFTNRIQYNPIFNKTNQEETKSCDDSKWLIPNIANRDVCPVRLFLKLMEKRPKNVTIDRFFLTPNPNWKLGNSTGWYKNFPVGINTISKWAKETARKVGVDTSNRKVTNHSFRSGNIPEQVLFDDPLDLKEENEQDEALLMNDVAAEPSVEPSTSDEEISSESSSQSPLSRESTKRKLFEMNKIENQVADAYKIMKKVSEKPQKEKDTCDLFSELLANKLREFSELQRDIIMNDIDNLVFRAKTQEIQNTQCKCKLSNN